MNCVLSHKPKVFLLLEQILTIHKKSNISADNGMLTLLVTFSTNIFIFLRSTVLQNATLFSTLWVFPFTKNTLKGLLFQMIQKTTKIDGIVNFKRKNFDKFLWNLFKEALHNLWPFYPTLWTFRHWNKCLSTVLNSLTLHSLPCKCHILIRLLSNQFNLSTSQITKRLPEKWPWTVLTTAWIFTATSTS